jgi:sugar lactone lactonase YvrE
VRVVIVDRAAVLAALPGYEVGGELGRGGFGLVLAARHRRLGREVAVKVLSAAGGEAGLQDRFLAEARVLAGLDHPHVVRIHDYVEHEGQCLLVMERLSAGTLKSRAAAGLSLPAVCAVGLAVAEALGCAHGHGVLHRDVKPDNVLFATAGLLKVTDFGIAKIFEGSASLSSGLMGTPAYMAPEQCVGDRLGPGTDLYALGVVLYELLARQPLFGAALTPVALLHHHLYQQPAPLPGVPAPVAAVVFRALAKDRAERHASAREFALDLARAAARAVGPGWLGSSGMQVRADDEVLDAARAGPVPRPAEPPTQPSARPWRPPGTDRPMSPTAPTDDSGPARAGQPATTVAASPLGGATTRPDQPTRQAPPPTRVDSPPPAPHPPAPPPLPPPGGAGHGRRGWAVAASAAGVLLLVAVVLLVVRPDGQGRDTGGASPTTTPAATLPTGASRPATPATLDFYDPKGLAVDRAGNLYVADRGNQRVRRVGTDGRVTTVAGTGTPGATGDGGPATKANLTAPDGVAVDTAGNLYICSLADSRVRRIGTDGRITTVAGTGDGGFSGDGGPATQAAFDFPVGVAVDTAGNLFIADAGNARVRRVGTDGRISTVAGTGEAGFGGDGGPATQAKLAFPYRLAVDTTGNLYIADRGADRVRRVGTDGRISTVAGSGEKGYGGDGGPATQAALDPAGLAFDGAGNLFIADLENNRVRRVGTDGRITTVAGSGEKGYGGDGGPATQAKLDRPEDLAVDRSGNLYLADFGNDRVRRVGTDGRISTVPGTGPG